MNLETAVDANLLRAESSRSVIPAKAHTRQHERRAPVIARGVSPEAIQKATGAERISGSPRRPRPPRDDAAAPYVSAHAPSRGRRLRLASTRSEWRQLPDLR
jgi:hypothetical protein